MRYLKNTNKILFLVCLALMLSACNTQTQQTTILSDEDVQAPLLFRISTSDQTTNVPTYEEINLDECYTDLYITKGGVYRLTGSLRGSIYVDTIDENVRLVLAGATIEGGDGPAILALSAGKLFITLEENTNNELLDAGAYDYQEDGEACIYAQCDVTINGTGSLTISGLYKDAVHSKDVLKVLASNIIVRAKRDGLRGNDGVLIAGHNIRIETERNGIRTTKSGTDHRGAIEIKGKNISVISGEYGIQAAGDLMIHHSHCYIKGILGNYIVAGDVSIEEGSLTNE